MVTSTAIEAANVSFGYDGGVTLTNLSFTVGAGIATRFVSAVAGVVVGTAEVGTAVELAGGDTA